MAIKNYTTKVKTSKTVAEIQDLLVRAGASSFRLNYDRENGGEIASVLFTMEISGKDFEFRLPCNPKGVLASMKRDKVDSRYLNYEQACRTSWRIIKDWIDSQLAIIESGQAEASEVFFPYCIDGDNRTAYQIFCEDKVKLLTE